MRELVWSIVICCLLIKCLSLAWLGVWKGFLDVTEEDLKKSLNGNVVGAFAFSREVILAFKDLPSVVLHRSSMTVP
jgi:hypothetical protein